MPTWTICYQVFQFPKYITNASKHNSVGMYVLAVWNRNTLTWLNPFSICLNWTGGTRKDTFLAVGMERSSRMGGTVSFIVGEFVFFEHNSVDRVPDVACWANKSGLICTTQLSAVIVGPWITGLQPRAFCFSSAVLLAKEVHRLANIRDGSYGNVRETSCPDQSQRSRARARSRAAHVARPFPPRTLQADGHPRWLRNQHLRGVHRSAGWQCREVLH